MLRPDAVYPSSSPCIVVLFDLREPGAAQDLHQARGVWQEDSDIEALDEDHFALLLRRSAGRRFMS
jgi:hypothetical protein